MDRNTQIMKCVESRLTKLYGSNAISRRWAAGQTRCVSKHIRPNCTLPDKSWNLSKLCCVSNCIILKYVPDRITSTREIQPITIIITRVFLIEIVKNKQSKAMLSTLFKDFKDACTVLPEYKPYFYSVIQKLTIHTKHCSTKKVLKIKQI